MRLSLTLALTVLLVAVSGQPLPREKLFHVVWQLPSDICTKFEERNEKTGRKTVDMNYRLDKFGFVHNPNHKFEGEYSVIFYDYGAFPVYKHGMKKNKANGGIPQMGNLSQHLELAKQSILDFIPDEAFQGLAVIDMEEWRPLWARNWGWKGIYRRESQKFVKSQHRGMTPAEVRKKAKLDFEYWARQYIVMSLELGKSMRPGGLWGYYHFPYCYNNAVPTQLHCPEYIQKGNDEMRWLWESSGAIMPSIYMFKKYNAANRARYIYGNLEEGVRVAQSVQGGRPVYAYTKIKYNSSLPVIFYDPADMLSTIRMPVDFGIEGIIIWGSKGDFQKPSWCKRIRWYIWKTVGPYVKRVNKFVEDCSEQQCSGQGRCVHRGALEERYHHEIMRLTMQKLKNFTINCKYRCRCLKGYKGPHCEQRGRSTGVEDNNCNL